jgi:hypothetical protein
MPFWSGRVGRDNKKYTIYMHFGPLFNHTQKLKAFYAPLKYVKYYPTHILINNWYYTQIKFFLINPINKKKNNNNYFYILSTNTTIKRNNNRIQWKYKCFHFMWLSSESQLPYSLKQITSFSEHLKCTHVTDLHII